MDTTAGQIRKETGLKKLTDKDKKEWLGDISLEKIKEIARNKKFSGNSEEAKIRQIIGSCVSYQITIDGRDPRELKNYGKSN